MQNKYFQMRVDSEFLEKLRAVAEADHRSMAGQVKYLIDQAFNQLQKESA